MFPHTGLVVVSGGLVVASAVVAANVAAAAAAAAGASRAAAFSSGHSAIAMWDRVLVRLWALLAIDYVWLCHRRSFRAWFRLMDRQLLAEAHGREQASEWQ